VKIRSDIIGWEGAINHTIAVEKDDIIELHFLKEKDLKGYSFLKINVFEKFARV